jgi:hypothetical protein
MINLAKALQAWNTPDFEQAIKTEIQSLDTALLPLQQGLALSSHVSDSPISVVVLDVSEESDFIRVKTSVFYAGIVAGSCCEDDPTPVCEQTEHCELLFEIDKDSGNASVSFAPGQ